MSPRKKYTFYIDEPHADALKQIKERDGILESEQIRRAIAAWLQSKGVIEKKTERKRASTRRRP